MKGALFTLLSLCLLASAIAIEDFTGVTESYGTADRAHALSLAKSASTSTRGVDLYSAASIFQSLGEDASSVCKGVSKASTSTAEEAASVFSAAAIAGCKVSPSASALEVLYSAATSRELASIRHGVSGLQAAKSLGAKVDASRLQDVISTVADMIDEDGTVSNSADSDEFEEENAGIALQIAATLVGFGSLDDIETSKLNENIIGKFGMMKKHMADVMEEDPSVKSFSSFLAGALAMHAVDNSIELDTDQLDVMAEFLTSRRHAGTVEGAASLLKGLKAVASNPWSHPTVLSVESSELSLTKKSEKLRVHFTDVFSNFISPASVTLVEAVKEDGEQTIARDVALSADGKDKTLYLLDFFRFQPSAGFYTLTFHVEPESDGLVIPRDVSITVKVATSLKIEEATVAVREVKSGKRVQVNEAKASFPSAMNKALVAKGDNDIAISFKVFDGIANTAFKAEQAVVRVYSNEHDVEAIFVASTSSNSDVVTATVAVSLLSERVFKYRGGEYKVEVIVGDSRADKAIVWAIGTVKLEFAKAAIKESNKLAPLDVIVHQFRQPEKRPAEVISMAFTGVIVLAFAIFVVKVMTTGNFRLFPGGMGSIFDLMFHAILAAMLGVLVLYFFQFNIFETLFYSAILGLPAVFIGNFALSAIATSRYAHSQ
uniref:Dolichyl-diphosphooligosaccharide--protein glycosyltransferase subunit 2 n=1 Tax=Palpitomonas bilix TaxID=652834 RepID=A0A7S3GIT3_9EUKA